MERSKITFTPKVVVKETGTCTVDLKHDGRGEYYVITAKNVGRVVRPNGACIPFPPGSRIHLDLTEARVTVPGFGLKFEKITGTGLVLVPDWSTEIWTVVDERVLIARRYVA